MASKFSKVKSEMSKRIDTDNTTMTAYRDYDFDRRSTDMKRLGHALEHFDHAVTQGMIAMKEIASAFEAVGQAFTELTLGTVNTYAHDAPEEPAPYPAENEDLSAYNTAAGEGDMTPEGSQPRQQRHVDANAQSGEGAAAAAAADGAASVASTKLTDETNGQVRRLARLFAEETRRMNEGQPFQSYNAGMHRDVVTRLRPVSEHLKAVEEHRQRRTEALMRYNKYKSEVEKVEKRYAKKGKPFCDSKSHKKYAEKRDEAWKEYVRRREKFNDTFALLMEVNDHAAAQIIHRYLALNDEYLRQLVASIGRILPPMEEAYPLNQEYTTTQNSMILEAVANARTPFARHYKENELEQAEEEEEGEEGEEDDDDHHSVSTGTGHNHHHDDEDGGKKQNNNNTNNNNARRSTTTSSSRLEEPTTDENTSRKGSRILGQGPLLGEEAGDQAPPHEDDDAFGDAVHGAGTASQEPGYVLTQAQRLQTGDGGADGEGSAVKKAAPLPGASDFE